MLFDSKSEMVPEGEYNVAVREEVELSSDPACNGADAIRLFLTIDLGDGEDEERELLCVIDPTVPARGSSRNTPYDFTMMTLRSLGVAKEVAEEAILAAVEVRAEGGDVAFTIPGLGSAEAVVKVNHKHLDSGKWAENLGIRSAVATPAAMSSLAAKLKARGLGGGSKASPFSAPNGR